MDECASNPCENGGTVVIKSMDTLANAPQDTMVIIVVMVSIRN